MVMMNKIIVAAIMAILTVCIYGRADAKIKVYLDETKKEYLAVSKLDCKVYEGRAGITIGFKAGNMLFSVGPEITLGKQNAIKWDVLVQGIIARYKELCSRFNSGAMTMKSYEERLDKIDSLAREALLYQEKMNQRVKDESKSAFKELDKETRGDDAVISDRVGKEIDDINSKVERLKE